MTELYPSMPVVAVALLRFATMLFFALKATPRLLHAANWLGTYLFGQPLPVVTGALQPTAGQPVFNYSGQPLPFSSFWIKPHSLLFDTGLTQPPPQVEQADGLPCFFKTGGDFPFDVLAASFYLLQRYEEYLPHPKDRYGRFAPTSSLAHQAGFLHLPLVDLWMQQLKKALLQQFPPLQFANRQFWLMPTYDVDIAFAYRGKGLGRNLWSLYRHLATRQLEAVVQQAGFVLQGQADPFDVFEELDSLHEQHHLQPVYFLLLAQYQRGIDKNINPRKKPYRRLIQQLAHRYQTGIHLSGAAAANVGTMKREQALLEKLTGLPAIRNRMHYLLLQLPETYRHLLQLGITEDYTMGYGTANGFRAGTCTPYLWYDLAAEKSTSLQIFPFCYMDAVSIFEDEATPAGALAAMKRLLETVQQVQGCFISIFHNHFIGRDADGRRWMELYTKFLKDSLPPAPLHAGKVERGQG